MPILEAKHKHTCRQSIEHTCSLHMESVHGCMQAHSHAPQSLQTPFSPPLSPALAKASMCSLRDVSSASPAAASAAFFIAAASGTGSSESSGLPVSQVQRGRWIRSRWRRPSHLWLCITRMTRSARPKNCKCLSMGTQCRVGARCSESVRRSLVNRNQRWGQSGPSGA